MKKAAALSQQEHALEELCSRSQPKNSSFPAGFAQFSKYNTKPPPPRSPSPIPSKLRNIEEVLKDYLNTADFTTEYALVPQGTVLYHGTTVSGFDYPSPRAPDRHCFFSPDLGQPLSVPLEKEQIVAPRILKFTVLSSFTVKTKASSNTLTHKTDHGCSGRYDPGYHEIQLLDNLIQTLLRFEREIVLSPSFVRDYQKLLGNYGKARMVSHLPIEEKNTAIARYERFLSELSSEVREKQLLVNLNLDDSTVVWNRLQSIPIELATHYAMLCIVGRYGASGKRLVIGVLDAMQQLCGIICQRGREQPQVFGSVPLALENAAKLIFNVV